MLGRINIAIYKLQKLGCNLLGDLHFAADDDARHILGAIGDLVLDEQQFQQVFSRYRHEQALGHVQPDILFHVVRLVFERVDLTADLYHSLEVASDNGIYEWS